MKVQCKFDEMVNVKTLQPHPKNYNKHPKLQIQRLAKLLKYQGIRAPIIVSTISGYIVKGHGTLEAIRFNGWQEAPVVYQIFENTAQEYAFLQSDNAIASWAELDMAHINFDLPELGPEFDPEMLGIEHFTVESAELPNLPSGSKSPFQQMTFILHEAQAETIVRALEVSKKLGEFGSLNENSNGNALARACELFLEKYGNG